MTDSHYPVYKEYAPSPALIPYIDKFWEFEGRPKRNMYMHVLPDGCTDIVFTLGEATQATGGGPGLEPYRSYFIGPLTRYSELVARPGTIRMLGIRFLPGGLFPFRELPLRELADQRIAAADLGLFFSDSFAEHLCEISHPENRIRTIETSLIKFLDKSKSGTDLRILSAIKKIERYKGRLPVPILANDACLCPRHFERLFKRFTGFTPKEYGRIIRFRHALELLKSPNPGDLLSAAAASGYYDASHLAKEIKTLAGTTSAAFSPSAPEEKTALLYRDPQNM